MNLYKTKERIDINEYTLQEYANFLESFDNKILVIETNNNDVGTIKIKLDKDQFPHLIGLDYCYSTNSSKKYFSGKEGFENLKSGNLKISELRKNFRNNQNQNPNGPKLNWTRHILPRIEYLPSFLNNIKLKKFSLYRNIDNKTRMHGDYLLFKTEYGTYLILSIINTKDNGYRCESFISNDGFNYYNPKQEIEITNIFIEELEK